MDSLRKENDSLKCEREHWKSRYESTLSECEKEREEKFQLQCEIQNVNDQMSEQFQYLSTMGAASCTLLWRVSRCEDSIESILTGSKIGDFLTVVNSTIQSYSVTYKEEKPAENSDETQFILALCGIVTNIAASAYGRNFLVTNEIGVKLLDSMMDTLSDLKHGRCAKMKNLILMTLYNVSINQKGLKIVTSKSGIIGLLVWILQGENDSEIQLNSIRLIQSLLIEQTNSKVILQAKEVISTQMLQQFAGNNANKAVQEAAIELMSDMRNITGATINQQ
ncbi:heat shock factor 2-binding protein-like [Tubulanus polymorphus]|uniref:heat shock factor 2-binding protein-like n=1 Tax=Tubulanus polymorphus TaxID=672921 RepID=UPI003DA1CF3F